jgi:hypothetical protein
MAGLTREREVIDDPDYQQKKAQSVRALLEDRYGNVAKADRKIAANNRSRSRSGEEVVWVSRLTDDEDALVRKPKGW